MTTFALIHSPLCGPATWQPVATHLQTQGHDVIVPRLMDDERMQKPLWQQQAESIADANKSVPAQQPIVWVAHSGAGLRLPAYRSRVANPTAAYIFVDAGIPHGFPAQGLSQLDFMACDEAAFAVTLQDELAQGGRFPMWTNDDLRDVIPDADLRAQMLAELQPRDLRYFAEPLPRYAGWPDAPCACLQFTEGYARAAAYARQHKWPVWQMPAQHFHMLVAPAEVTIALCTLAQRALENESRRAASL
jgi:hypothetical protein